MVPAKKHSTILVASLLTAKRWEQPKYPSADEWINNIPYIHKMEYYSAMKKNQVQATTWTNLENIIKDARHKGPLILRFYSYETSRTGPALESARRLTVA